MKNNFTKQVKKLLFSFVLFSALALHAQKNEWVWQAGSSLGNQRPVYGKQNIPNNTNTPGGRGVAATWTDKAGNFWMFGGESYTSPSADADTTIVAYYCSDMWKFNFVTTQWVWVSGSMSTNTPGVYGKQGVASAKNLPGARGEAISWVDANGNFWLFGGLGFDSTTKNSGNQSASLNDLWMYNPTKNQWTWVSGGQGHNTNGNYATKNIASGGMPGSRLDAAGASDASGNFWMFGGQGYDQSSAADGGLGDLWEYVTARKQWIWQSGSNQLGQFGNYGTKGTGSINNYPSSKENAMGFTDALGNFYLFGGYGPSDNTIPSCGGDQNDLWKYTPSSNEWTWVNGTSQGNQTGVYGKLGSANPFNTPGGRFNSVTWLDSAKNFWIFGGDGADSAGDGFGALTDLWEYSITTNQWAFMGGSGKAGIGGQYGTLGTPSANNLPASRYASQSWIDASHNLWLYGGFGVLSNTDLYNSWFADAWELITPTSALPITLANLQASAKGTDNLVSWQTVSEVNSAYFNVQRSSGSVVNFTTISMINAAGNSTVTLNYAFTDIQPLQGDNLYRLKMVDKDGKINYSNIVSVNRSAGVNIKIYPNPVADVVKVDGLDANNTSTITIIDITGNRLSSTKRSGSSYSLNIQQLAAGTYYLQVIANKTTTTLKFVKQ